MALPMLNLLIALLGIVFALAAGLSALASLIYACRDHGFQRRLDIAYALFAALLAWTWLSDIRQSFDRVSDPHLQSVSVDSLAYIGLIFWSLLTEMGFSPPQAAKFQPRRLGA